MILSSPGGVAFDIFGFSVYWYGIIMACAIFIGAYVADWTYKQKGGNDLLMDLFPWLVLTGFAGARLYYCLLNHSYYLTRPLEILNVRQGGLSVHGMFLAVVVFLVIYCKKKHVDLFSLTAPLCVGVAIAQCVGRWGNFFNSEAFGKPFDGFLKLYIEPALRPEAYASSEYFHPAFLYESVLDLAIFVVLFWCVYKSKASPLFVTSLYFMLYGIVRVIVEGIRIDSVAYIYNLPVPVIASFIIIIFAAVGLLLDLKSNFR